MTAVVLPGVHRHLPLQLLQRALPKGPFLILSRIEVQYLPFGLRPVAGHPVFQPGNAGGRLRIPDLQKDFGVLPVNAALRRILGQKAQGALPPVQHISLAGKIPAIARIVLKPQIDRRLLILFQHKGGKALPLGCFLQLLCRPGPHIGGHKEGNLPGAHRILYPGVHCQGLPPPAAQHGGFQKLSVGVLPHREDSLRGSIVHGKGKGRLPPGGHLPGEVACQILTGDRPGIIAFLLKADIGGVDVPVRRLSPAGAPGAQQRGGVQLPLLPFGVPNPYPDPLGRPLGVKVLRPLRDIDPGPSSLGKIASLPLDPAGRILKAHLNRRGRRVHGEPAALPCLVAGIVPGQNAEDYLPAVFFSVKEDLSLTGSRA